MSTRRRTESLALGAVLLISACARLTVETDVATRSADPQVCAGQLIDACEGNEPSSQGLTMLAEPHVYADTQPTSLTPQPDGTPLPPRDPHVADHWPPEVKEFVDNMLDLFKNRETAPTVEEIERRFNIKLELRQPRLLDGAAAVQRYRVTRSAYLHTDWAGIEYLYQSYMADKGSPEKPRELYILGLPISNATTCLNPYELAVYTGAYFINGQLPPPDGLSPRKWEPAYAWGMFKRSPSGEYQGKDYSILVDGNTDEITGERISVGCVDAMRVSGRFKQRGN